jgi:glutamine amidotransferase
MKKIVIIDYGVGNVFSVYNAIKYLGYSNVKISYDEKDIFSSDALILPGVGAFDEAMKNITIRKLDKILNENVLINKKPLLGVCVGMQILSEGSDENGWHKGLGWIPGKVKKLELSQNLAVPHVGWNNLQITNKSSLFLNQSNSNPHFYFDHSYYFETEDKYVSSYCDYGMKICASVQNENIYGVQFHPEKSQNNGLKLFRSFLNSVK